jgi:hypothetical protein
MTDKKQQPRKKQAELRDLDVGEEQAVTMLDYEGSPVVTYSIVAKPEARRRLVVIRVLGLLAAVSALAVSAQTASAGTSNIRGDAQDTQTAHYVASHTEGTVSLWNNGDGTDILRENATGYVTNGISGTVSVRDQQGGRIATSEVFELNT